MIVFSNFDHALGKYTYKIIKGYLYILLIQPVIGRGGYSISGNDKGYQYIILIQPVIGRGAYSILVCTRLHSDNSWISFLTSFILAIIGSLCFLFLFSDNLRSVRVPNTTMSKSRQYSYNISRGGTGYRSSTFI